MNAEHMHIPAAKALGRSREDRLLTACALVPAEASATVYGDAAIDILQLGGIEEANISLQCEGLEGDGASATLAVEHSADGAVWAESPLSLAVSAGEAAERRSRIPLDMGRYLRLKVTTGGVAGAGSAKASLKILA